MNDLPKGFLQRFNSVPLRYRVVAAFGVCLLAYGLAARSSIALVRLKPDTTRANVYVEKILVANRPGFAPDALIDKHLINPWGIALRPPGAGGHIWISNAGNL